MFCNSPSALAVLALAVELGLVIARPLFFARLAFLPIGRRFIALSPEVREVLTARASDAADYRSAPAVLFHPRPLAEPRAMMLSYRQRLIITDEGDIVVTPTFARRGRTSQLDVMQARLSLEPQRLALAARVYPTGLIFTALTIALVIFQVHVAGPWLFFLPVSLVIAFFLARRKATLTLERVTGEMSRRVEALTIRVANESRVRVAHEPEGPAFEDEMSDPVLIGPRQGRGGPKMHGR